MTKRKFLNDEDPNNLFEDSKKQKISRPKLKLENSPPVNNIKDLIVVGDSLKFYKNILDLFCESKTSK